MTMSRKQQKQNTKSDKKLDPVSSQRGESNSSLELIINEDTVTDADIFYLQRTVGNREVIKLLQGRVNTSFASPQITRNKENIVIQRNISVGDQSYNMIEFKKFISENFKDMDLSGEIYEGKVKKWDEQNKTFSSVDDLRTTLEQTKYLDEFKNLKIVKKLEEIKIKQRNPETYLEDIPSASEYMAMLDEDASLSAIDAMGFENITKEIYEQYLNKEYLCIALGASPDPILLALKLRYSESKNLKRISMSAIDKDTISNNLKRWGAIKFLEQSLGGWPEFNQKILLMDAMSSGTALTVTKQLIESGDLEKHQKKGRKIKLLSLNDPKNKEVGDDAQSKGIKFLMARDAATRYVKDRIYFQVYKDYLLGRLSDKNLQNLQGTFDHLPKYINSEKFMGMMLKMKQILPDIDPTQIMSKVEPIFKDLIGYGDNI